MNNRKKHNHKKYRILKAIKYQDQAPNKNQKIVKNKESKEKKINKMREKEDH